MSDLNDFYGPNAGYVVEQYEQYQRDPGSVPPATRALFERWRPTLDGEEAPGNGARPAAPAELLSLACSDPVSFGEKVRGAASLAQAIREYGHLCARIDPLGSDPPGDPELSPGTHGIREEDLAALPPEVIGPTGARGAADALEA